MDLQLHGKHVLITGGSRGIGLACAREFLNEGCRVSIVGRDAQRMEQARATLGTAVAGFCADLRDAQDALRAIEAAEQAHGPIDILVNSAGAARRTPYAELAPQAWRDAMDSKFFTTINVLDPVVRRMGARGAGSVVNVIGMGGKVATPTHLPGGSANAALMLASAGLAAAWGAHGVRVNAVNPTLTLTDRLAEGFAADARLRGSSVEEVRRAAEARMPLGRLAQPEEIAAAVLFLASPKASYISGAILSLDGAATPMVV
ncbi:SDR family oxidoreductase [Ramlibacter ginsenosidimutans]|uniref:SDR family oxidoreductase n=1 Tax=Ramlibacter ginsenosidimutans TaxID=502333 RepID=A0A934TU83_9BURK|nr:SDR family oxidoreductase [Ramlibacter ginsenosidimutans]MBK6007000.1 SDR family oxidoreductase [Ramlibacter ginsenosidimutans]